MFFSVKDIKSGWGFAPKCIIHVGAHEAEEYDEYLSFSPREIHWVEAQADKCILLEKRFKDNNGIFVYNAAVWGTSGRSLNLKITNNGESSSLLDFGTHATIYPDIVNLRETKIITKTLDELFAGKVIPDLVNIDIQGAELQALQGAKGLLPNTKMIYLEVNQKELYKGLGLIEDIDNYLTPFGFTRSATRWWLNDGWGDAIYISSTLKSELKYLNHIYIKLLKFRWSISQSARLFLKYLILFLKPNS